MIDIERELGAVQRSVGTGPLGDAEGRVVRLQRTYDSPIEDVWDALTTPERISRWFLPISGDYRLGGRYQLEGNAGGNVLSCDPPRTFSVTWEYDGHVSWVIVTLTPDGTGTELELVHDAPSAPDHWDRYGPGAVGIGWELGLIGLAEHLTTGAPVDPAAFAAWMASEDGVGFMAACSGSWAEARIAAGDDTGESRAAAARCTAAYTGQE